MLLEWLNQGKSPIIISVITGHNIRRVKQEIRDLVFDLHYREHNHRDISSMTQIPLLIIVGMLSRHLKDKLVQVYMDITDTQNKLSLQEDKKDYLENKINEFPSNLFNVSG